jgi:hypothetical protein
VHEKNTFKEVSAPEEKKTYKVKIAKNGDKNEFKPSLIQLVEQACLKTNLPDKGIMQRTLEQIFADRLDSIDYHDIDKNLEAMENLYLDLCV